MHDILIGGLIAIIVMAQILVAISTSKKISLFKTIVPEANSFESVKVFIPEDQIKTVTVEYILNNLSIYSNSTSADNLPKEGTCEKILINIPEYVNGEIESTAFYDGDDDDDETNHDNTDLVWVMNGTLEEKIPRSSLYHYQDMGWSLLYE
ncbi:hypothetical protein J3S90_09165 [Flavobacterium sp. P4023]|uniref:Uncharacterized protein n=1 Tax=Flavobacterium flabelliforme TaxID=2816119 RepID=A0ABS5CTM6_9FLAO|nr:hypothetical protein [Flavobacterium flabelliforme]MBP4141971.1 hypothetical protein [Flavobacterium flabelliforme]